MAPGHRGWTVTLAPPWWWQWWCWLLFSFPYLFVHNTYAAHTSGRNNTRALLYNAQRNIHANISELLDNLLRGYDNSVRPDFGGKVLILDYSPQPFS